PAIGDHRTGRDGRRRAHGRARCPAQQGGGAMTRPLLIENARIVDPASNADLTGAILVKKGRIADIAEGAAPGVPDKANRLDARGLVLSPGLIDMRVFTGEPGHEYRETLRSAGQAAAAGGVTSILVMPDTQPVID